MAEKQSTVDSAMETVTNIAIGFVISWAVMDWIVSPLYGFGANAGEALGITMIFTVTSLIRQFALRRLFNGKSVWQTIKDRGHRPGRYRVTQYNYGKGRS